MSTIPTKSKLDEYVRMGLVRSQNHPTLPLTIYTYSELTSFERLWNSVTRQCRGLVVDDKGRCVVRCMPKFFNEDEPHALCDMPKGVKSTAYDKLDGSLIQVVNDREYGVIVTSKGSFVSKQANWAREIVNEKYTADDFSEGMTYVFELIHPENRIVLDYGSDRNLYLIAAINTETGNEYSIHHLSTFPKVKIVRDMDHHMSGLVEGIVVKTGQHRFKVKTGEYIRLHRIVTEFTEKRVWEALSSGQSLEFTNMPEEFQQWLDDTVAVLMEQFDAIASAAQDELTMASALTDKELGLATNYRYKGLVFMLRSSKDIAPAIWKMIKPKGDQ